MASALFDPGPNEVDHPFFRNLASTKFRPDVRAWCDDTFARAERMLDADFPRRLRRDTPQRISELFFAAAFLDAGWEPAERVVGFDLAFKLGEDRLLVEVTTPDPPDADTWETVKRDGVTITSSDERSEDAALRRLTGGFASKARIVKALLTKEAITERDYVVLALSGLRLSQETPTAPEVELPGFAKAFLPIGSRYVRFRLGEPDDRPLDGGYLFKDKIEQEGKTDVDRNAFLREDFRHIDAVAYTPFHLGLDAAVATQMQTGVLHNPMSSKGARPVKLGMGEEYVVEVGERDFTIRRF